MQCAMSFVNATQGSEGIGEGDPQDICGFSLHVVKLVALKTTLSYARKPHHDNI